MTDIHPKKVIKSDNTANTIIAGIAGVVAGGAAVAAAVLMSDKKNQKKVHDALDGAKEKVADFVQTIKSQPVIEKITQKIDEKV